MANHATPTRRHVMKNKYAITFLSDCYDLDGGYKTFWLEYAGNGRTEALRMLTRVFERTICEEQKEYTDYKLSLCPDFKIDRYNFNAKNNIVKRLTFSLIRPWVNKNYYVIDLIEIPGESEIDERLFMDNTGKVSLFSAESSIKSFFEPFYAIIKTGHYGKKDLVLVNPSSMFFSNVLSFRMGYTSKEAEILGESTIISQENLGALYPHSYRKLCSIDFLTSADVMYGYYGHDSRTVRSVGKWQIDRCDQKKEQYLREIQKIGIRVDHCWRHFPETLMYDAEYLLKRPGEWIAGANSKSDLHFFIDNLLRNSFSKIISGSVEDSKILVGIDKNRSNDQEFRDVLGLNGCLIRESETAVYIFIRKIKNRFFIKIEEVYKHRRSYLDDYINNVIKVASSG